MTSDPQSERILLVANRTCPCVAPALNGRLAEAGKERAA